MAVLLYRAQPDKGPQIWRGACVKGAMDGYWGVTYIIEIRKFHQGMQKVSGRKRQSLIFEPAAGTLFNKLTFSTGSLGPE